MADYGDKITFTAQNGQKLTVRGALTHMPTSKTYEHVANSNGTLDRTVKYKGYGFEVTLAHRQAVDYEALLAFDGGNITVYSEAEKVTRVYGDATFAGDISLDSMTGEVTGLKGGATAYQSF